MHASRPHARAVSLSGFGKVGVIGLSSLLLACGGGTPGNTAASSPSATAGTGATSTSSVQPAAAALAPSAPIAQPEPAIATTPAAPAPSNTVTAESAGAAPVPTAPITANAQAAPPAPAQPVPFAAANLQVNYVPLFAPGTPVLEQIQYTEPDGTLVTRAGFRPTHRHARERGEPWYVGGDFSVANGPNLVDEKPGDYFNWPELYFQFRTFGLLIRDGTPAGRSTLDVYQIVNRAKPALSM